MRRLATGFDRDSRRRRRTRSVAQKHPYDPVTRNMRNKTNQSLLVSCGFVMLRVISWIVALVQQPARVTIAPLVISTALLICPAFMAPAQKPRTLPQPRAPPADN